MPHYFVSSALILVGILGLFTIALMLFSYKSNVFVNIYLVIIFIICSIRNMAIGLMDITNHTYVLNPKLITPVFLIIAPALFLYFKSLINDYKQIQRKHLIHVIYPALNLLLNIGQVYFNVLKNGLIEDVRFVSILIFFMVYTVLSFNVLYKNLWKKRYNISVDITHYHLIKNWTLFLFIISSFLFFRILCSIYSEKLSNELFRALNYSYLVIIPWLLVYGKIFINPEILYGYPKLIKRLNPFQKHINFAEHVWIFDLKDTSKKLGSMEVKTVSYISELEHFVENHHPFRNTKFSFVDLAKALNIPSSHLDYIFKYHAIVTFDEYKDYCRIKDALQLINEGALSTLTLEGLSDKIGFSTYQSFSAAFKRQTQLSPQEYLTQKDKTVLQDVNIMFS
jgi:AraC-like DNA-binding protein